MAKADLVDHCTKVLVFGRRFIGQPFLRFASQLLPGAQIEPISDERGLQRFVWWKHRSLRRGFQRDATPLSRTELSEVVCRCRMLRALPNEDAVRLAQEAAARWRHILSCQRVELVLSLPVDSFVIDTLLRAASELRIPALTVVGTPFPGRIRFTRYGEFLGRGPFHPDDVPGCTEYLRRVGEGDARPAWLIGSDSPPARVASRRAVIDLLKWPAFWGYRQLFSDPNSYSFAPRWLQRRRMLATIERAKAALAIEKCAASPCGEYAYLPLQFYPETTSDYWIREKSLHDFHLVAMRLAPVIARQIPLVIKEHPAALGRRPRGFLSALQSVPGVTFAPVCADSQAISRASRVVIGNPSTSTFQSQLMGLPTLFFGAPYFGVTAAGRVLGELSETAASSHLESMRLSPRPTTSQEALENCLRFWRSTGYGSMGRYKPIGETTAVRLQEPHVDDALRQLLRSAIADLDTNSQRWHDSQPFADCVGTTRSAPMVESRSRVRTHPA